jgi:hypothetical protein
MYWRRRGVVMLVLRQRGGGVYLGRIWAREGMWRNDGLLGQS